MLGWVSRRRLLAWLGSGLVGRGALTATGASGQSSPASELSDEAVREILLEEAEPGGGATNRASIKPFWCQKPEGSRPAPNWPPDNVSFDFAHIADVPNVAGPFELTGDALKALAAQSPGS